MTIKRKMARKGAPEAFIRTHLGTNKRDCILWPYAKDQHGYGFATIAGRQMRASRWMCILAHGLPTPTRTHAAHDCGNASCINPNHIRWKSPSENAQDKFRHGTANIGERHGQTTITEQDVRDIRAAAPDLKALAAKYNMSRSAISHIRCGSRWGHVK